MVKRAERLGERAAAGASGGASVSGASREALPKASEELLLKIFAVQTDLPPTLADSVAARTGCTPAAALAFFMELHTTFKRWLRHLAGASSAPADEAAALAAAAACAAAREAALDKLRQLLDGSTGGLRDASATRQFTSLMAGMSSNAVRLQAAQAVAASKRTVRAKLAATPGFLSTLEAWLESARQQEFYTLLRQLLTMLGALPIDGALLSSCSRLHPTVRRLQDCPHAGVAAAAADLAAKWQAAVEAAATPAASLPSRMAGRASPSAALSRQPGNKPAALQGQQSLPSAGVHSRPKAPPSANGSTKQQERSHPAEHLHRPRQQDRADTAPPPGAPGVGRPAVQPARREERAQQQPPAQRQQQQQQQQQQQHSSDATAASRRPLHSSSLFQKMRRNLAAARSCAAPALSGASGASGPCMPAAAAGGQAGTPRSAQMRPGQTHTPARAQATAAPAASGTQPMQPSGAGRGGSGLSGQQPQEQPQAAARGGGGERHATSALAREEPPPPPLPPLRQPAEAAAAMHKPTPGAAPSEARSAAAGPPLAGVAAQPAGPQAGGGQATAPAASPVLRQAATQEQPAAGQSGNAEPRAAGAAVHDVPAQEPRAPPRPAQQAARVATARAPAATQPRALLYAAAPDRAAAPRLKPSASGPAAAAAAERSLHAQQQQQQQRRQHWEEEAGSKRARSLWESASQRWQSAEAAPPAADAAASGHAAKRQRHPVNWMSAQVAWRAPPACDAAASCPATHSQVALHACACGEESSEASAMAAMRRAGRLPACDDGGLAQEQVPAMPWWPLAPGEVQEQKARLEAAGWRGWAA